MNSSTKTVGVQVQTGSNFMSATGGNEILPGVKEVDENDPSSIVLEGTQMQVCIIMLVKHKVMAHIYINRLFMRQQKL